MAQLVQRRARRPCFDSRHGKIFLFSTASRPALGTTQPPIQWVPGVKRLGPEADHSPPASAEIKNSGAICTSTPPYVFKAWCLTNCTGTTLPLPYPPLPSFLLSPTPFLFLSYLHYSPSHFLHCLHLHNCPYAFTAWCLGAGTTSPVPSPRAPQLTYVLLVLGTEMKGHCLCVWV
jgi:hypothetical protein